MPEIVRHGVTGYLVAGTDQAVDAARRASTLDRRACRREAEARFDAERMVDDYERLFRQVAT
jgi:glycosyltransferase involved in cell wall biosynthesis